MPCSVRRAICCALASWVAVAMNCLICPDRSLDICSRSDAWSITACGLFEVSSAPIWVMVPFSKAVDAIDAISSRSALNLAWSALTSRFTRFSCCLALVSCSADWSYICTATFSSAVSLLTIFCTWCMVGLAVAPAVLAHVARPPAVARLTPAATPTRSALPCARRTARSRVPRQPPRSPPGRVLTYVITLLLPPRLPGELTGSGCGRCPTAWLRAQPGRFTPGGPVARAVARRVLRWVPGSPAGHAWPAQRLGGDRSPPPKW